MQCALYGIEKASEIELKTSLKSIANEIGREAILEMMSEKDLMQIAVGEMKKIFGLQYLRDNFEGTCTFRGFIFDKIFQLFVGLKTSDDLPDRKADEKGWVVYGLIWLDANTGEVLKKEYAVE